MGEWDARLFFITEAAMKPQTKEKCSDSGILTFNLAGYANLHFAAAELFMMLDKEMFNINTK